MKRISLRILLTLFTFVLGISLTALWMLYSYKLNVQLPDSRTTRNSNFTFDSQISDRQKENWRKEVLTKFREKPLEDFASSDADESYRLVLIPTFDTPIVIRVWKSKDRHFLVVKRLKGEGGYEWGKLASENTKTLSQEEWNTFILLLNNADFWGMPAKEDDPVVGDGTFWAMEGARNKIYHGVHRIFPDKDFRESCEFLIKLSELQVQINDAI